MTNFEIAMLLVLIAYGIIFGIICAGLFSRTRRNKSGIEITNKILDYHNSRIDGINNKMDFLVQIISNQFEKLKVDKEDASTNSKAGYGYVFELKKASWVLFDEQISVYTIDDLKAIWDKYGHSTKASAVKKLFNHNRLIIDFDENRIIIYDNWVE